MKQQLKMKNFFFILFLTYVIVACNSHQSSKGNDSVVINDSQQVRESQNENQMLKTKDTDFIENGTYNVVEYYKYKFSQSDTNIVDTITKDDYKLFFSSIDSVEYFSTLENYYQDINIPHIEMNIQEVETFEEKVLNQNNFISLQDSVFLINTKDSIIRIYKQPNSKNLAHYSKSIYKGFIPELGLFVFWNEVHEGGSFYGININTKEKIFFYGYPKFSPNRTMILSSYYDIEFGFYVNGFELYNFKNDTIEKVFHYEPTAGWGPEGMIWKNDSTLYFMRQTWDQSGLYNKRYLQSVKFRKIANR